MAGEFQQRKLSTGKVAPLICCLWLPQASTLQQKTGLARRLLIGRLDKTGEEPVVHLAWPWTVWAFEVRIWTSEMRQKLRRAYSLLEIIFWPLAVMWKQRKKVPRHVKLELCCSSFIEVVGQNYLYIVHKYTKLPFKISVLGPLLATCLIYLLPDRWINPLSLQAFARRLWTVNSKAVVRAAAAGLLKSAAGDTRYSTSTSRPVRTGMVKRAT